MQIGIGGIWHETNTFAPDLTRLEDFEAWQYAAGEDVLTRFAGTRTEVAGALAACARLGAEPRPLVAAAALPSGTVARDARAALWRELLARLRAALPLDGVVLTLHGAMVSEDVEDAESDLPAEVRSAVGELAVAVTLDLHANPGRQLLEDADLVLANDTYPHIDPYERGAEAVELLVGLVEGGLRAHVAWRKLRRPRRLHLPLETLPYQRFRGWRDRPWLP